jgi:hypothetical protein
MLAEAAKSSRGGLGADLSDGIFQQRPTQGLSEKLIAGREVQPGDGEHSGVGKWPCRDLRSALPDENCLECYWQGESSRTPVDLHFPVSHVFERPDHPTIFTGT